MSKERIGRLLLEASAGMHGEEAKILSDAWCDMARKNEELKSRIEAHEKDSERYKLRIETIRALYPSAPSDIELDTAIDAAMKGA